MMGWLGMELSFLSNMEPLEQRLVKAIISDELTENLVEKYKKLDDRAVNALYNHPEGARKETLLTLAATCGKTEILSKLLKHPEANPNATNEAGNAPLHIALVLGHIDIVFALLQNNHTDILQKNKLGLSARNLSRQYYLDYPELEEIMMLKSMQNREGFVPMRSFKNRFNA